VELVAGALVDGKARLIEPLGQGSMGVVWVAEHLALKTRVAVKFLHRELAAGDEVARARFEREASTAAQVKSPYVVQTFDHGVVEAGDGGQPFIVMELLEGESLVDRLARRGPLEPAEVATIVAQIGHALAAAHKQGIVHRDVKPGNIFVAEQGEGGAMFCKLLDFGIAKQTRVAAAGPRRCRRRSRLRGRPRRARPTSRPPRPRGAAPPEAWASPNLSCDRCTARRRCGWDP
jgi:serine/threonine-protein kinase